MIPVQTAGRLAATFVPSPSSKETPTLGEELREVFRYLFNPPERRLRATDFVWSYDELSDDIPD
jgi:hypothetical protein